MLKSDTIDFLDNVRRLAESGPSGGNLSDALDYDRAVQEPSLTVRRAFSVVEPDVWTTVTRTG